MRWLNNNILIIEDNTLWYIRYHMINPMTLWSWSHVSIHITYGVRRYLPCCKYLYYLYQLNRLNGRSYGCILCDSIKLMCTGSWTFIVMKTIDILEPMRPLCPSCLVGSAFHWPTEDPCQRTNANALLFIQHISSKYLHTTNCCCHTMHSWNVAIVYQRLCWWFIVPLPTSVEYTMRDYLERCLV